MNAHTPGPWTYYQNTERSFVIIPVAATESLEWEGVEIGEVFFGKRIKDPEANARIFANAPDLYNTVIFQNAILSATAQFLEERGFDMKDAYKVIDSADALINWIDGVKE